MAAGWTMSTSPRGRSQTARMACSNCEVTRGAFAFVVAVVGARGELVDEEVAGGGDEEFDGEEAFEGEGFGDVGGDFPGFGFECGGDGGGDDGPVEDLGVRGGSRRRG